MGASQILTATTPTRHFDRFNYSLLRMLFVINSTGEVFQADCYYPGWMLFSGYGGYSTNGIIEQCNDQWPWCSSLVDFSQNVDCCIISVAQTQSVATISSRFPQKLAPVSQNVDCWFKKHVNGYKSSMIAVGFTNTISCNHILKIFPKTRARITKCWLLVKKACQWLQIIHDCGR